MLVRDYVSSAGRVYRDHTFKVVRPTPELCREHIPPGLNMLGPEPDDDPTIVEVWL